MKKYIIHFFVFGIVLAVLYNEHFQINLFKIYFFTTILVVVFIFYFLNQQSGQRHNHTKISYSFLILIIIFIFAFSITLWRIDSIQYKPKIPYFNNQKIELTGKVSGEVDIRAFNTRLTIETEEIFIKEDSSNLIKQIIKTNERIIIVTNHFPQFKTGDELKVFGKIQLPENFTNENNIEFDYVNYLAKDDIHSISYYPKIKLINRPDFDFNRSIFLIKNSFLEKAQKVMPSPEAELLGGILVGTKRSLGTELEEKFRVVGLIHIVVLSGYNVTIIAEAIFRALSFLPRIASASLGIISIIIFSIMVGSGATVVRSTIMTILALVSRLSNQNYNVNRALFFAGSLMVFHNPDILLHDPSFQLSFLATIGLINISDFVKKFIKFLPERFEIREITSATLSTQIAVLPLLTKMTGEISVVAPIVNIMTLQVIPLTMLLGFIAGVIAFFSETLGMVLAYPPYLLLSYILKIVDIFAAFPIATIKLIF